MTLPNDFLNTPNKTFRIFNESANITRLIFNEKQVLKHNLNELSRTVPTNSLFSSPLDVSFDWVDLDVLAADSAGNRGVLSAFKSWEFYLEGVRLENAPRLKHNFLFKFGESDELFDQNLRDDILITKNTNIEFNNFVNSNTNILKYNFSVFIQEESEGLIEINNFGMKIKLQLYMYPLLKTPPTNPDS